MLTSRIREFTSNLQVLPNSIDSNLKCDINDKFAGYDSSYVLSSTDIEWLKQIIITRSRAVVDDLDLDYTMGRHINARLWGQLAYDIDSHAYLQLLFPEVVNARDAVLFSPLVDGFDYLTVYIIQETPPAVSATYKNSLVFDECLNEAFYYYESIRERIIINDCAQLKIDLKFSTRWGAFRLSMGEVRKWITTNGNFFPLNLHQYFLGDSGKTLHVIEGLKCRIEKNYPLSIYENFNSHKLRNLSLLELWRIKQISAQSFQDNAENKYTTFGTYFAASANAIKYGECPRHKLPQLLELLKMYFKELKGELPHGHFREKLIEWSRSLRIKNNIYWFNAQTIDSAESGKKIYMIDALVNCLNAPSPEVTQAVMNVVRWLCKYDASFLVDSEECKSLYESVEVGPGFTLKAFSVCVLKLQTESKINLLTMRLKSLLTYMENKTKIDEHMIVSISNISKTYWDAIKDSIELRYTSTQKGINALWIRLSQLLHGAGSVADPYLFLMPTLTHNKEKISFMPLSHWSLSHYILSEHYDELILLDYVVFALKNDEPFRNPYTHDNFTIDEEESLKFAYHRFQRYIPSFPTTEDPPISYATLMQIKLYVEACVHTEGLYKETKYFDPVSVAREEKAFAAFANFIAFYLNLPDDERKRLNAQCMVYGGKKKRFFDIMQHIQRPETKTEKPGCAAKYGMFLLQLLLDYLPDVVMAKNFEVIDLQNMRGLSRKKVFSADTLPVLKESKHMWFFKDVKDNASFKNQMNPTQQETIGETIYELCGEGIDWALGFFVNKDKKDIIVSTEEKATTLQCA